jgi:hypothetical protein
MEDGRGTGDLPLRQRRSRFLGRVLESGMVLLGVALILTLVGRLLGLGGAPPSGAQYLQAGVGAVLVAIGASHPIQKLLSQPDRAAGLRRAVALFPWLALAAFLPYRLRITDLDAYARRVAEGSLVEWLSFLFLLFAAVLLLLSGWRDRASGGGRTLLLLGGGSLLIALEEMSWGQTLFHWHTPEFFNQTNVQHETNLHNLAPFHASIWTVTAGVFCLLTLLTVVRALLERRGRIRPFSILDALLPQPFLFSTFLVAAAIYVGVAIEKAGTDVPILITREQEVAECLFALGVLLHAARSYLHWAGAQPVRPRPAMPAVAPPAAGRSGCGDCPPARSPRRGGACG